MVNIAQIFHHSGLQLTCRAETGVKQPADLKGRTLGVWFSGNEYPFLAWMAKLGLTTAGDKPDVTVVRQDAGVELLLEGRAACISTMSYNEYWQVIDAGVKAAQLLVFRYEDQGVATLETGFTRRRRLADPAMADQLAAFCASVAGWRYAMNPARPRWSASCNVPPRQPARCRQNQRMLREVISCCRERTWARLSGAGRLGTRSMSAVGPGKPGDPASARAAWTHAVTQRHSRVDAGPPMGREP